MAQISLGRSASLRVLDSPNPKRTAGLIPLDGPPRGDPEAKRKRRPRAQLPPDTGNIARRDNAHDRAADRQVLAGAQLRSLSNDASDRGSGRDVLPGRHAGGDGGAHLSEKKMSPRPHLRPAGDLWRARSG